MSQFLRILELAIEILDLVLCYSSAIEIACGSGDKIHTIGLVHTLGQYLRIKNHSQQFVQIAGTVFVRQFGRLCGKEFFGKSRRKFVHAVMMVDAVGKLHLLQICDKRLVFRIVLVSGIVLKTAQEINYNVDKFADIEVLRYTVPGFEDLSLQQKTLIYYLTEAAIAGRDIIWDQNCKYNLPVRDLLENVYKNYSGDENDAEYKAFVTLNKSIFFRRFCVIPPEG